jgi:hypothetical protein
MPRHGIPNVVILRSRAAIITAVALCSGLLLLGRPKSIAEACFYIIAGFAICITGVSIGVGTLTIAQRCQPHRRELSPWRTEIPVYAFLLGGISGLLAAAICVYPLFYLLVIRPDLQVHPDADWGFSGVVIAFMCAVPTSIIALIFGGGLGQRRRS